MSPILPSRIPHSGGRRDGKDNKNSSLEGEIEPRHLELLPTANPHGESRKGQQNCGSLARARARNDSRYYGIAARHAAFGRHTVDSDMAPGGGRNEKRAPTPAS